MKRKGIIGSVYRDVPDNYGQKKYAITFFIRRNRGFTDVKLLFLTSDKKSLDKRENIEFEIKEGNETKTFYVTTRQTSIPLEEIDNYTYITHINISEELKNMYNEIIQEGNPCTTSSEEREPKIQEGDKRFRKKVKRFKTPSFKVIKNKFKSLFGWY